MVNIAPLKALFFSDKAGNINELVTPPFDVITKPEREQFRKNPNNIIYALLPDSPASAASFLSDCIKQKLIVPSDQPYLYLYSVTFTHNHQTHTRVGLVALLELSEFSRREVLPHEQTIKEYVQNTLDILQATKTNLNPIFTIYPHDTQLQEVFAKISATRPLTESKDKEGVVHRLWQIKEQNQIQTILHLFKAKSVVIADGHHRYEAGLLNLKKGGSRYILAMLVDSHDPGLKITTHCRLIDSLDSPADKILKRLGEYCEVEPVRDLPVLQKKMADSPQSFGLYMDNFYFIKLRDISPDKLIPEPIPKELKELDVIILHLALLPKIFGIHSNDSVHFYRDPAKAVEVVKSGSSKAAFILNPVDFDTVRKISELGEVMPPKSTYFFPKPLSGFVMYKADI